MGWTREDGRKYEYGQRMDRFESSAHITGLDISTDEDKVHFELSDGTLVDIQHDQQCCESVGIDKIDKVELLDVVNDGAVVFEVKTSDGTRSDVTSTFNESSTFTFITVTSRNNSATFSFKGESNGYYSEDAAMYVSKPVKD